MNGGDGFSVFKNESRNHKIGTVDIDHFTKYVEKMSPILTGVDGRIVFVKSKKSFSD